LNEFCFIRICLAEFASSFTSAKSRAEEETVEEDGEPDTVKKLIRLKDGLGTMKERTHQIALRDYPISKEKDSEKYYHRLLLLITHGGLKKN
jgi:hypothetical protein